VYCDLEWVWGVLRSGVGLGGIWSGFSVDFRFAADFGTSVGFSRWGSKQRHGLPPSSEVGLAWKMQAQDAFAVGFMLHLWCIFGGRHRLIGSFMGR
jgi:hypothetical protein